MVRCEGTRVPATAGALAQAVRAAKEGETLCLEPGKHAAGFQIPRSLRLVGLQGAEQTVLEGDGRSPVLSVAEDGLMVTLEGLTIAQGRAENGGGLMIQGRGEVHVVGCTFRDNEAGYYGGGAIYADAGLLRVSQSLFTGNRGNQGGAVLLDQAMKAVFEDCLFEKNHGKQGGALRVREGVIATFTRCTFRANEADGKGTVISLSGTSSRAPEVQIISSQIGAGGSFDNGATHPAKLTVESSKLPAELKGSAGFVDGGGNSYGQE